MISCVPFLLSCLFAKRFGFLIEALFIQLTSFLMFYLFIFWNRRYICMAPALKNTKRYLVRSLLLTCIPIQPNFSPQRQSILSVSYMFLKIFQVYRSKYVLIVILFFFFNNKKDHKQDRISILTISIQHCTGGYSQCKRARKRSKTHPN